MLSPSRVKYRKVHRGSVRGQAKGGTEVRHAVTTGDGEDVQRNLREAHLRLGSACLDDA